MNIVREHGINDTPYGWTKKNEWNKKVYQKWQNMLERVYSEKYHDKKPTYINCTLCLEWHYLSKFAEDFIKIDGYDEEKFLNGELVLDKDVKSNGTNKEYSLENCVLISKTENSKQACKTRDNKQFKGENNPFYGKHHSKETKEIMSKNKKGKFSGENHPRCRKIAQRDINGNLIKIWSYIKQISEELDFVNYNSLLTTLSKKTNINNYYKGYIWEYVEEENDNE